MTAPQAEIQIVPASAADAASADRITRAAFDGVCIDQAIERAVGPAGGVAWGDIKGRQVRDQFERTPEHCLVARCGGAVVGYVTCDVDRSLQRGRILDLAVDSRFRGRGLGRRLIQHALDHFRRLGLRQAKIETLANNAIGSHLYPSMGFVEIARQIHYVMRL